MKKENAWRDLSRDYSVIKTPNDLETQLRRGRKKGKYMIYGFLVPFTVTREYLDVWVVHTEKMSRSGGSAGGHYYVYKKNPKKAIWD